MQKKTAISINKDILDGVEQIAKENNFSKSYVFSVAARDYIERHRNKQILEQINSVYDEGFEDEEKNSINIFSENFSTIVEETW